MRVDVLRPGELGEAELTRWRTLQAGNPTLANAFLGPEFTLAVGRVRPQARVGVVSDGGETVAFFPFERYRFGLGGPIGAGLSDCQGVVHADGWQWDTRELLARCGLSVWEFDHLIADQKPFEAYHRVRARSPIMDLEEGYQAYLDAKLRVSKRTMKSTLYKGRKLERDRGKVRFEFDCRDDDALRQLMEWKSAQYRRTLRQDRFARPSIVALVEDLFEHRSAECAATLSMMYVDDRPVAGHLGLRSPTVLACWFPAYDVELAPYSPGLLLHLQMAEAAAEAGIRTLDLGKGNAEYKDSLSSGDLYVAEGWAERPSAVAFGRRVARAPRHYAVNFVVSHPKVLDRYRRGMKAVGRLRPGSRAR